MADTEEPGNEPVTRPWAPPPPGRLVGRGHPAGDFLEAWAWDLLDEAPGYLRIEAELPHHVRNPRGQLFGGFTPTYVDLLALFTVRAGESRAPWKRGQTTFRMTGDQEIRGVRSEKLSDPFSGPA